jgi:hypothetical protein
MWAVLLGAAVGGFFALAAGFTIELRRDRRRQIAAARLVLAEFRHSNLEIFVEASREQARVSELDPAELDEAEAAGWLPGPHPKIRGHAWLTLAAEFVGALNEADFDLVDRAAADLRSAGDSGFTIDYDVNKMRAAITSSEQILGPLTKPTWVDRHVWRL